jgi:hypothetical protein
MGSNKINWRLIDWLQWDWTRYLCEKSPYCPEKSKSTPVGVWCLRHYLELRDCRVEGCSQPVTPEHRNQGQGLLGLCREHLIDEDPEVIEQQRDDIISPRSSMADIQEHASKGGPMTNRRPKKKERARMSCCLRYCDRCGYSDTRSFSGPCQKCGQWLIPEFDEAGDHHPEPKGESNELDNLDP